MSRGSRPDAPWASWYLYFPDEAYDPVGPQVDLVGPLINYFRDFASHISKDDIETNQSVTMDYTELIQNCQIPSLAPLLRDHPARVLTLMALSIHEVLRKLPPDQLSSSSAVTQSSSSHHAENLPKLSVSLINYEPLTPLKDLKANLMSKFIAIRGTVVRVSSIKPNVIQGCFVCRSCTEGACKLVKFTDGKFTSPGKCGACKSQNLKLDRSSPDTITLDWQKIRIQEIVNDDKNDSGRIPRCVEVELQRHLVDSCVPGDIVHVAGIVKVAATEDVKYQSANKKTMYLLYLDANSVTNCKSRSSPDENSDILQFSLKDMYAIREIADQRNLFRLIVHSISPAIYGHEIVKAGLALALFGGKRKYTADKNKISVRGDPHVLVVGDPGMGKSQMLQAVASIAPRGVYVAGNATTTAGLTVTLHKDSSGDYALEAGALILGDQGCCCIDEFDKMGADYQALLEAMEQQSVSIAKAGICCSLPSRTSVLAAANPVGGHYDKARTVSENLKMSSALLSRFDLIFILLDKPDEEMDHFLSEHVMALHSGRSAPRKNFRGNQDEDEGLGEEDSILGRLRLKSSEKIDPIPPVLLRKYIGYARKYVEPSLTPAAAKVLQSFYLDLRKKCRSVDSTPITTRQLESMIRLAEARARLELREKVLEEDARDVIEIMKLSLFQTAEDEFGNVDFQRSQHGTGMSKAADAKRFVAHLEQIASSTFNNRFTIQQLNQIGKDIGLRVRNFDGFIDSLNQEGYLLKRGPNVFSIAISSMP